MDNFSSEKYGGQKIMGWHILPFERKNTVNQEFYIWENYPSKVKKLMKTFSDKEKLREVVTSTPVLKEILKGVLKTEMKGHYTVILSHAKK